MPYAMVDKDSRIIQWSYEPLDGLNVQFSNGDYVDENCVNGVSDFRIINGQAVYDPTIETIAKIEQEKIEQERESFINSLPNDLKEFQNTTYDSLIELGEIVVENQVVTEENSVSINDLMEAIVELASMIAGEE